MISRYGNPGLLNAHDRTCPRATNSHTSNTIKVIPNFVDGEEPGVRYLSYVPIPQGSTGVSLLFLFVLSELQEFKPGSPSTSPATNTNRKPTASLNKSCGPPSLRPQSP